MEILLFALCGFVVGLAISFTGVGGGVLLIPVIAFFFDLPPSVAIGTAGIVAALTKIFAAADCARAGNINYRLFARTALFAAPGVLLAAAAVNLSLAHFAQNLASPASPAAAEAEQTIQQALRICVIIAIAASLLAARLSPPAPGGRRGFGAAAFFVGAMMGVTGIGGGVLIAPLLLAFSAAPPKKVVGTSILTALLLSAGGAAVYAFNGQADFRAAAWMSGGALLATWPGGVLLRRAAEQTVRRAIFALVFLAAVLMVADGFRA